MKVMMILIKRYDIKLVLYTAKQPNLCVPHLIRKKPQLLFLSVFKQGPLLFFNQIVRLFYFPANPVDELSLTVGISSPFECLLLKQCIHTFNVVRCRCST